MSNRELRVRIAIVVILIIAAILRLNKISQPYIDSFSWRQSSTAMIAENYYRTNWNIFYPEVNWTGPGPNYQGREFQTVSYLAALLYLIFGQQDLVGRLISVCFGIWGIFALYKLVRRVWDEERALVSAVVMAVLPSSIFIDRSFIPDPAMVSLVVTSLWLFVAYLQNDGLRYLILAALIAGLGFLTKITGLIVGLPMAYAVFSILSQRHTLTTKQLATIGIVMSLSLVPVIAYYFWAKHLSETYPPYIFSGAGNWLWDWGIRRWLSEGFFLTSLSHRINYWLWSPPVLILVLFSLLIGPPRRKRNQYVTAPWFFHWWLLAGVVYYFIGAIELIGNPWNFHILNPAAAALAGHAIVSICSFNNRKIWSPSSLLIVVVMVMIIILFGNRGLHNSYKPYAENGFKLGLALRKITKPGDLIITIPDAYGDPVAIYYSRRRGWVFPPAGNRDWGRLPDNDSESIRLFEDLRTRGARWLGIVGERKNDIWKDHTELANYLESNTELHSATPEFYIYRIITKEDTRNNRSGDSG